VILRPAVSAASSANTGAVQRSALVAGATGVVGVRLLAGLLESPAYARVIALVRRAPPLFHDKLQVEVVDFERLPSLPQPLDDVFCCLGTTLAKAGGRAAFSRVDHDYVVELAKRARAAGARRFLMVSALGADPGSRVFYSRTKGEAERDVAAAGIDAWFFRPSLIDGERAELRRGERIGLVAAKALAPLLGGRFARYRPVAAGSIAAAMIRVALSGEPPPGAIESEQIAELAA
jgi:uncharacterized protein YbjT (DUF2867 family)